MAASSIAHRLRSALPHLNRALRSDPVAAPGSFLNRAVPAGVHLLLSRSYAVETGPGDEKESIKDLLSMYGWSGNYANALYRVAAKVQAVDKVESDVKDFLDAALGDPDFSQLIRDPTVNRKLRVQAINEALSGIDYSEVTKDFIVLLAERGKLRNIDSIAKKFSELAMDHRGEVKAIVTTIEPLQTEEELELKETLQELLGQETTVILDKKIDPSILGGILVEFDYMLFDASIKTRAQEMARTLRQLDPTEFALL